MKRPRGPVYIKNDIPYVLTNFNTEEPTVFNRDYIFVNNMSPAESSILDNHSRILAAKNLDRVKQFLNPNILNTFIQEINIRLPRIEHRRINIEQKFNYVSKGPNYQEHNINVNGINYVVSQCVGTTSKIILDKLDIGKYSENLAQRLLNPNLTQNIDIYPLIDMAINIYKNLYINQEENRAHFYCIFSTQYDNETSFNIDRRDLDSSFFEDRRYFDRNVYIVLKLSSDPTIIAYEIMYLMYRLAYLYRTFTDAYDIASENFITTEARIRQIISTKHYTFSHVIQGTIKVSEMRNACINAQDPILRAEFKRLYDYLDQNRIVLTSPGSYRNCLFIALILGEKNLQWENLSKEKQRNIQKHASKIKKEVYGSTDKFNYSIQDIKKVFEHSKYRNTQIYIFNFKLELICSHLPPPDRHGDLKKICIYLFGGHAFAAVFNKNFIPPDSKSKCIVKKTRPPIQKREYYRAFAWDIETTQEGYPYAIGMEELTRRNTYRAFFDDDPKYKRDVFLMFLEYLHKNFFYTIYGYAHNSGKFDSVFLLKYIRNHHLFEWINMNEFNGRILELVLVSKHKKLTIILRDSYALIRMPLLKACQAYNTFYTKDEIDHKSIHNHNYKPKIHEYNIYKYLKYDIKSLKELLNKDREVLEKEFSFNIHKYVLTSTGIANYYFHKFHNFAKYPLFHPSQIEESFIRKGYFGGICQNYYRGIFKSSPGHLLLYLDVNSFFPAIMAKQYLPYGKGKWHFFTKLPADFFGFVHVKITGGRKDSFNIFRFRSMLGLIDPAFKTPHEGIFFSELIRLAIKYNNIFHYNIQFIGGYSYKKAKYMKDVIELLYKKKLATPKNTALYKFRKEIMNSIYGRHALRSEMSRAVLVRNPRTLMKNIIAGGLVEYSNKIAIVKETTNAKDTFITLPATITGWSHVILLEIMIKIQLAGYKVYYTDTDSLITDMPLQLISEIYPIHPTDLGALSFEVSDTKCEKISEICLIAPKAYSIKYADNSTMVKLKGFPRRNKYTSLEINEDEIIFRNPAKRGTRELTHDLMCDMVRNNKVIKCEYTQFVCGKKGMLTDEPKVSMTPIIVEIRGRINKGILHSNGKITPKIV